jgi:tetratricopeptide (TPR) repeat protein
VTLPSFTTANLSEIPTIASAGVSWKPVRRHLGISAFGVNAFTAAAAGDELIEDHDELGLQAGNHQELYFVAAGAARFTVDGAEIEAPTGTFVFVGDSASRRSAQATEPETTVLVMGAPEGAAFTPSEWEFSFAAEPAARTGDLDRALAVIHEGLDLHPNGASLVYNLACYETLAGHNDEALAHLVRALALDPAIAEWARTDADLDPLRNRADFPDLTIS